MKRPFSLQRRLGISLVVGGAVIWLCAIIVVGSMIRNEIDEAFDSSLEAAAVHLLPLTALALRSRQAPDEAPLVSPPGAGPADADAAMVYIVRAADGRVLLRSRDADPTRFPPRPEAGFQDKDGVRIFARWAPDDSMVVEVAEPMAHRDEEVSEAMLALSLPVAIIAPSGLLIIWLLMRYGMRPLRTFSAQIETRGGNDLSLIPVEPLPAELSSIGQAVNRLMERLRRVLEAERNFSSNSAHELRTPVAAALAQAQRLIAEAPEGPLRHRAEQIESSMHHLAGLSEKLMQLARAEGGGLLSETPADLAPVLMHVVGEFREAAGVGQRLRLAANDPALSRLDADAFAVLIRNLVENALKHGDPDAPVDVILAGNVVRVVNAGPSVAPPDLAALKGRFARGASRVGGSGLGLAIAEAVASGAGADLTLLSPASGRADGFEAVLRLPD